MGNRAVITTEDRELGVYVHWNGGRDSIEAALKYCDLQDFRYPERDSYGWARLCEVLCNFHSYGGLSVGISAYTDDERMNPGDNGIYIIREWKIVDRVWPHGHEIKEQSSHSMYDLLLEYDACMPAPMQLGKAKIAAALGMPVQTVSQRLMKAAEKFLISRGYEIDHEFETDCDFVHIACMSEKGDFVFVGVAEEENDLSFNRDEFEALMAEYLKNTDIKDRLVRYDIISFNVIADDRAIVRHHIGARSSEQA